MGALHQIAADTRYEGLQPAEQARIDHLVDAVCEKVDWALQRESVGGFVKDHLSSFARDLEAKLSHAHVRVIAERVWAEISQIKSLHEGKSAEYKSLSAEEQAHVEDLVVFVREKIEGAFHGRLGKTALNILVRLFARKLQKGLSHAHICVIAERVWERISAQVELTPSQTESDQLLIDDDSGAVAL